MRTLLVFTLLFASFATGRLARRPGAAPWLGWLGIGFAAAALAAAFWSLAETVGDHRRAGPAGPPPLHA